LNKSGEFGIIGLSEQGPLTTLIIAFQWSLLVLKANAERDSFFEVGNRSYR